MIETMPLGRLCTIRTGCAYPRARFPDRGLRVIRISNVREGWLEDTSPRYLAPDDPDAGRCPLRAGDILVTLTGYVGRTAVVTEAMLPAVLNQRIAVLRVREGAVDPAYLAALLGTAAFRRQCLAAARGSAQQNLSAAWLRAWPVPLPDAVRQRETAAMLGLADHAAALCRDELAALDRLADARGYALFGDPARSPWPMRPLRETASAPLTYGAPDPAVPFDGTMRYVRITDILPDGRLGDEAVSPARRSASHRLHDGDLLLARSGATVGKCFLYDAARHGPCQYAGYLIRVVPDRAQVLPVYLHWLTGTPYFRDMVARACAASSRPNVNARTYGAMPVPVPPLDRQETLAAFLRQIDTTRQDVRARLDRIAQLRPALERRCFPDLETI